MPPARKKTTASSSSPAAARGGRSRLSLDDAKKKTIVGILAIGGPRIVAAHCVGCCVSTIRRTAKRDPDFARQLREAESAHEIRHLKNINSAATEGRYWRAAAWALERKYPNRYGERRGQSVTAEQVAQLLAGFAEIIVDEVPEGPQRTKILKRLEALSAELNEPQ